jgi:hypothetical protein
MVTPVQSADSRSRMLKSPREQRPLLLYHLRAGENVGWRRLRKQIAGGVAGNGDNLKRGHFFR